MDVTTRPALDDKAPVKRRKLRKGTRSCLDCRRRKVKCIFTAPESAKCITCERRGAQCISQYDSLAPALDHVVGDDTTYASSGPADSATTDDPSRRRDYRATLLLDDSFPTPRSVETPATSSHGANKVTSIHSHRILTPTASHTHASVTETLIRDLPCENDISTLSDRLSALSALQYESDYRYHGTWSDETSKRPTSFKDLLQPERHPTLLARQMLLFAAAVQHLSPKELVSGFIEHHTVIMKKMAESAIRWVNMDDSLLGTLEAVENLIFEMFYHVESSNLRRAWITTHRAVTAAQMLGLHRPGHHRFARINYENDLDPDLMWTTIVSMERILSLLLGLPTSTSNMALRSQTKTNGSPGSNLSAMVADLAGKIIQRNETESPQTALDMTSDIDREIISAAEQMPSEFWRPLAFSGLERDSLQALMETRRAFGHMCYYSLIVQLHLPHMLHPRDASRRLQSKIACVNASREVLTREIELRTFNPIAACCRMSDFLALIAGMALMIGHITSLSGNESDNLLRHQRLGDRAIVERNLDCITPMSDLQGDMLAVRCSDLLRSLLAIEKDAASQFSLPRSTDEAGQSRGHPAALIVRVPYLGSIQISRAGVAAIPAVSKDRDQQMSEECVTIGGIGSMSVQESRTVHADETESIASNYLHQAASISMAPHDSAEHRQTALDTPVMMSNPVFPDAAACFDDWVFQGVDTAFMETLLSGSGIPFSEDLGDESWDISTLP